MLLGTTTSPGEDPVPNPDIFDLFDVIDFDIPEIPAPVSKLLENANPSMFQEEKNSAMAASRRSATPGFDMMYWHSLRANFRFNGLEYVAVM